MRKPDFFIVGAPRCGTSAMRDYLKKHPEVFLPRRDGEFHFFGSDLYAPWFIRDEPTYLSFFAEAKDEKRLGEKSARYLYSKRAASEIKAFMPTASIIMLRNPADQIFSLHSLRTYQCVENLANLETALEAEEDRGRGLRLPRGFGSREAWFFLYREVPKYAKQVKRFLDVFGRENVHIVIFDDFVRDTEGVYRETLRFLGVNTDFRPDFQKINANRRARSKTLQKVLVNLPPSVREFARSTIPTRLRHRLRRSIAHFNIIYEPRPPLKPELRKRLQSEFLPEVEAISELLGRDLTHWCKDQAD